MNNLNLSKLQSQFPNLLWQAQVELAPYTYMKVGGPAEILWEATDCEDLVAVVRFCQENNIEYTLLGGASNVLIRDGGLDGLVIINRAKDYKFFQNQTEILSFLPTLQSKISDLPELAQFIWVQSGISTAILVGLARDQQLTGLEPFLGVPGTLGGAIFNNSHYQQELIGNFVVGVDVVNSKGQRFWLTQEECDFAYDHSRFQTSKEIILSVVLYAMPGDTTDIQAKMKESTVKRATTQPLGTANSGCMFQNPSLNEVQAQNFNNQTSVSAGLLIDQAGLKGLRVGGAVVSDKHANFIVNDGTATSSDIEKLTVLIREKVWQKFGIELKKEVFFIGKEKN